MPPDREKLAAIMGAAPEPTGSLKGSDVLRINIGIFGVMNAGKSTLLNRITRQVGGARGRGRGGKSTLMNHITRQVRGARGRGRGGGEARS